MARNREELYEMLDKADKAGDTAGARDIYKWIQETPAEPPPPRAGAVAPPAALPQPAQAYRLQGSDPTQAPSWYEELGGGLKHSLDKSALGLEKSVKWAANKVTGKNWEVDPENVQNVERGKDFVKNTGALSTVGEVGGDLLQGAAAGGLGNVVKAGKYLPAAVDIASQAGWGALTAADNKGEAAAWGGGGAAAGRALPHAVNWARKGANAVGDFAMPGRSAAGRLTKHMGSQADEVTDLARKGLASGDSMLPQTTAGLTGNVKVAGLEAGIPGRGLVDLSDLRAKQAAAKSSALTKITAGGDKLDDLTREADTVASEGVERLRKMPLGKERKAGVVAGLESLKTTDEVIGNTHVQGAINRAQNAINDPNSSTLILTELRKNLPKGPEFDSVRNVLMEAANERSKFIASAAEEGAGAIRDKATAAQASKSLRGEYLDQGRKLKDINELSLNKSLTAKGLDSDVVEQGAKLSDEVRRANLYKNAEGAHTDIKKNLLQVATDNPLGAAVAAFLSAGKTAPLHAALKVRDHLTRKAVDQAVADPKKWVEIMGAKQARGAALEAWEKALYKTLRPATVAGAVAGKEIGEENAP
jgi:hypothetical protein